MLRTGVGNLKPVMTYCRDRHLLDALASFFFAYSGRSEAMMQHNHGTECLAYTFNSPDLIRNSF
jgi:hypothetical protein